MIDFVIVACEGQHAGPWNGQRKKETEREVEEDRARDARGAKKKMQIST